LALAEHGRIVASRSLDEARRHARDLAPTLQAMLCEREWKPAEIAAVLISLGPGSYTGLRVGVMSAKTFAFATGCALVGIPTLPLLALQAPGDEVDVIEDAQQDRVFAQSFRKDPDTGLPIPVSALAVQSLDEWIQTRERRRVITGPGLIPYRHKLPTDVTVTEADLWRPRPASLLCLGMVSLGVGELADVWKLEPLYAKPSSAEELWAKRGK
jgi:tRNA threonylcarbamoyladenosine biosynthesis protein TsaB